MALAIVVDTLRGVPTVTDKELIVEGTIVFSGTYPAGGDTLSFANNNKIQSRAVPLHVEIYEQPVSGGTMTGAEFAFIPGTTQANGILQITTAYTVAFPTGAYTAALLTPATGTTVKFRAYFPLGN
jgi:hypothetical protein